MVLLMSAFALLLARVIKDYGSTLQHVLLLALPIKALHSNTAAYTPATLHDFFFKKNCITIKARLTGLTVHGVMASTWVLVLALDPLNCRRH